jgi:hypothetical protein
MIGGGPGSDRGSESERLGPADRDRRPAGPVTFTASLARSRYTVTGNTPRLSLSRLAASLTRSLCSKAEYPLGRRPGPSDRTVDLGWPGSIEGPPPCYFMQVASVFEKICDLRLALSSE